MEEYKVDSNVLKHVAIILDGNGRWAKQKNMPRTYGHAKGTDTLVEIVKHANLIGLKYLSVYAFSTENWNRSEEEVTFLMNLFVERFRKYKESLKKDNIHVKFIGTKERLSNEVIDVMSQIEDETRYNTGLTFLMCFNYGGKEEIVHAAKELLAAKEEVNEKNFAKHLYTGDVPDVDLMIRTSGEMRLSNFLLWQNAYAEFFFTKTYWPAFTNDELDSIIDEFMHTRKRRFGKEN